MDNPFFEVASGLQLLEGVVLGYSDDGMVIVRLNNSENMVSCQLVIPNKDTSAKIDINDEVLVAQASSENTAYYILGIIGIPLNAVKNSSNENKEKVETVSPRKPMTAIVDGKRIKITAEEEIMLSCGEGSIHIMKDGKIALRGTDLISRASRINKIRGAAVRIN